MDRTVEVTGTVVGCNEGKDRNRDTIQYLERTRTDEAEETFAPP